MVVLIPLFVSVTIVLHSSFSDVLSSLFNHRNQIESLG